LVSRDYKKPTFNRTKNTVGEKKLKIALAIIAMLLLSMPNGIQICTGLTKEIPITITSDDFTFRHLTEGFWPFISGDGSKVVFERNVGSSNYEIFIINSDGTNLRQLTDSEAWDVVPSISFDGSKVVFQSDVDGDFEIFIINSDGTNLKQLTSNDIDDYKASINMDGSKIAFLRDAEVFGKSEIFVMNSDGSGVTGLNVFVPTAYYKPFSISDDGSKIAFVSVEDTEIYIINSDGSGLKQLTDNNACNEQASISGDGSKVVFTSDVDGDYEIFVIDSDGSHLTQLTHNNDVDTELSVNYDGSNIAFSSGVFDQWDTFDISLISPDNSELTQITIDGYDGCPSISNDGLKIVFEHSSEPAVNEIYIAEVQRPEPETTLELIDIEKQDWNQANIGVDVSEYIGEFEDGKPYAYFGNLPITLTLKNTGDEKTENTKVQGLVTGDIVLMLFNEHTVTRIINYGYSYPFEEDIDDIDAKSVEKISLKIPIKYISLFCGPLTFFENDQEMSIDVVFGIGTLNVQLKITGNFDDIDFFNVCHVYTNPDDVAAYILAGLVDRFKEEVEEEFRQQLMDYISEVITANVLPTQIEELTSPGTKTFPISIPAGTTALVLLTILPPAVKLTQFIIYKGSITLGLASIGVFGSCILVVKPPDLVQGEWNVQVSTACPDEAFNVSWITVIGEPQVIPFEVFWKGETYIVEIYSNLAITDFDFSQDEKCISFKATGSSGTTGFSNVTIPRVLLDSSENDWLITTNNIPRITTVAKNTTHTYLYFRYNANTPYVKIIGTSVIPEFGNFLLMVMLIIATLIVSIVSKRRLYKTK
jgi:Tol biopolymer transport system component